jgi:prepilin-type N-terminal cleavage/methylation domain-containing protein
MMTKKAFTLIELILVIAIIGIISLITIPKINSFLPSLELSSSSKDTSAKLRQAQEEAITTQIGCLVSFNLSANPITLKVIKLDGPNGTNGTILDTVNLPNGITLTLDSSITNHQIIFSSDGGPNVSGNIVFTLNNMSKTINISPAGVIKVY